MSHLKAPSESILNTGDEIHLIQSIVIENDFMRTQTPFQGNRSELHFAKVLTRHKLLMASYPLYWLLVGHSFAAAAEVNQKP